MRQEEEALMEVESLMDDDEVGGIWKEREMTGLGNGRWGLREG